MERRAGHNSAEGMTKCTAVRSIRMIRLVNPALNCVDTLHGPLRITVFGVPDYRKLYAMADVLTGGVLSGQSREVNIFNKWLQNPKRPLSPDQAPPNTSKPPATQSDCRSCSAQRHCPSAGNYQCVADVMEFANTRLMEGCCKLSYYATSQGRRLLSNSSLPEGVNSSAPGNTLPAPLPVNDFGCACNCTYISRGCCGVEDGIVHEPVPLKLGFLNSTECCSSHTGSVQQPSENGNSTEC